METWAWVVGWTGFYQVSDLGRVRSVDRIVDVVNRFGNPEQRLIRGKVLKPTLGKNGYLMVSFTRPGGVRKYAYVHQEVAAAFLGPAPDGCEVCHNDGVRVNNPKSNLRYGTRSANALDRHEHGTMNPAAGEQHYCHKLTEADVRWIRANAGRMSQREMGQCLGVTHSTIGSVIRGVWWRHVA